MPDSKSDLYLDKAEKIVSLLRRSHAGKIRKINLSALYLFLGITVAGLAFLSLLEITNYQPAWAKSLSFLLIISGAFSLAYFLFQRLQKGSFTSFYEHFFRTYNMDRALSAIDLYLSDQQKQSRFYKAALCENLKSVEPGELQSKLDEYIEDSKAYSLFRNSSILLLVSVFLAGWIGITKPAESMRTLHFWENYVRPNPFEFTVTPGDTTIEHGSAFRPAIRFESEAPGEVHIAFKTDVEDNYRIRPMRTSGNSIFLPEEIELTNNIHYHILMDDFFSDDFRVEVRNLPRFDQLSATITPPAYTGLPQNYVSYPFSELNMYEGSSVVIEGVTNKSIDSLIITRQSTNYEIPPADSLNNHFSTQFTPDTSDTISFRMSDKDGLSNRNPFRVFLNVQEDQRPSVTIREPTGTISDTSPEQLQILYRAADDFGLSKAELHWDLQRAYVSETTPGSVALQTPSNARTESVLWDVSELDLRPRDEVSFRIRIWDNDEISGWKWGESQSVVLKVPSLTEYFEELDHKERDLNNELETISDNFEGMEQEFQQFLEQLRQNPQGGFEEEQNLEEIRVKQQSVDEAVQKMNEQFQQIRSEMENNSSISNETKRAYQELQQLMEELDDPGLREALDQLQNAMENMSPREIEQALEEVNFNEKLYKERLERTVELFKRLKMNSDLDKLARQYEDMSERLSGDEDQPLDQLTRELETTREEMDQLSDQIEQLDQNPPERSEKTLRDLKESAGQELENLKQQVEDLQQDASEQNNEENPAPTEEIQQQQEQISEKLQQEAEKFRSSVQQMSGMQMNINILALQRALFQLLELSEMQEFISETSSQTRSRSQGFVELARIQKNISDQFTAVGDTLFQISSEIPGVPNQINQKKAETERTLSRSVDQMTARNQNASSVSSRESLGGINDLSSMIASLLDQLMNQQGGGGAGGMSMQQMVEQLQNMSGDQQQLNQQLQQMINDMQGERLTREESERLDQLSRQQNEIRKQLQQLQRNGGLDQGDRTLSELQRLIDEMEDSINDMRGGVTDPIMVQRQQNILSRMLNAEEALQQRGEDEEREGSRTEEIQRSVPPDITLEELQQEIRTRLQDPDFTRFNEQYQRLIELYFEQLRRLEGEP
ncbi:MAG: hypothetical protein WD604_01365 [Balneolaceae bacterium]